MGCTVVALNAAHHDAAFAPVRAIPGVEVIHAPYVTSWEEISARRTGAPLGPPPVPPPELAGALARADVVFGFAVPRNLLALAPRCRWVATPATGIDHLRGTDVLDADVAITTAGTLFGAAVAEHAFAGMLWFARRLRLFAEQQAARTWKPARVAALEGRTVGLLGVGGIGGALAVRARAFGMTTLGLARDVVPGRTVPGIDRLLPRPALPELLRAADYVVVSVPDTPATRRLLGATELACLRPEAVLVNVARGVIVDQAALVAALRDGRFAGAALDVFEDEPLPADSPLWAMPNVLVTPHVATNVPEYLPRALEQLASDLRRFLAGRPLEHTFDRARGY